MPPLSDVFDKAVSQLDFSLGTGYLRRLAAGVPCGRLRSGADVAQAVEQLIRNQQVGGSSPPVSSRFFAYLGAFLRQGLVLVPT